MWPHTFPGEKQDVLPQQSKNTFRFHCRQCHTTVYTLPYLDAPIRIIFRPPTTLMRQRVHPIVQDLLTRMQRRLTLFKWLTNNVAGVSMLVARSTCHIAFIRSVVDYLSPSPSQLPKTALEPIEKFQNKSMRLILGCPISTITYSLLDAFPLLIFLLTTLTS